MTTDETTDRTAALIALIAETHVHPGVGQTTGAIDLPVARERVTDFPFIPGSSVKGAFRVWVEERAAGLDVETLFGKEPNGGDAGASGQAGQLLLSDARLLLLPVRALTDAFKWVTCPDILRRLQRDMARAGHDAPGWTVPDVVAGAYLGLGTENDRLGLEEREFDHAGNVPGDLIKALAQFTGQPEDLMRNRLVVLSDSDFTWFARYALPVMARNVLDADKTSQNLWYEETLAPDTIMYLLVGQRNKGAVSALAAALDAAPYIQIGGNETIGQGWFRMQAFEGGRDGQA